MSLGKIFLASVFLLNHAALLTAQWGSGPRADVVGDPMGSCSDIELNIKDSRGRAIMGATVVTEKSAMPFRADIQGLVSVPCRDFIGIMTELEVRAPGFKPSKVIITRNSRSPIGIILKELHRSPAGSSRTVGIQELRQSVRHESRRIQAQVEKALQHKDYDAAEKLYLEAMRLTPSDSSIPNNLGVLALSRNDLNAAGSWFEMALQLDPYKAGYAVNLGILRWLQSRKDESYQLLIKAAAQGYESDMVHYIIGRASLEKGLYEEAVNHLKKAPQGRFPYRDLFLSIALHNLGEEKAAENLYWNFLRHNPFPFAFLPSQPDNPALEDPRLLASRWAKE